MTLPLFRLTNTYVAPVSTVAADAELVATSVTPATAAIPDAAASAIRTRRRVDLDCICSSIQGKALS
ncbi:hypothetical protein [Dactylosporangium sp. CS-033363]|uniref:hypothetical protein n=1 Tax=Dactylosporangium sp. CS-033363 TaxID=3239935 RepID=UPI003D8DD591